MKSFARPCFCIFTGLYSISILISSVFRVRPDEVFSWNMKCHQFNKDAFYWVININLPWFQPTLNNNKVSKNTYSHAAEEILTV